jgi:hypothetical protein
VGTKTQIAVTAFALLLPTITGGVLRTGDLAEACPAIEPPETDTLPPPHPGQPRPPQVGPPNHPT